MRLRPPDAGIHMHVHTREYFLSVQQLPQERGNVSINYFDRHLLYTCISLFCQFRIIKHDQYLESYRMLKWLNCFMEIIKRIFRNKKDYNRNFCPSIQEKNHEHIEKQNVGYTMIVLKLIPGCSALHTLSEDTAARIPHSPVPFGDLVRHSATVPQPGCTLQSCRFSDHGHRHRLILVLQQKPNGRLIICLSVCL